MCLKNGVLFYRRGTTLDLIIYSRYIRFNYHIDRSWWGKKKIMRMGVYRMCALKMMVWPEEKQQSQSTHREKWVRLIDIP